MNGERHSKLLFPVHKITAKTPEELFKVLPGLKRYFNDFTGYKDHADIPHERTHMPLPSDQMVKMIKYIVYVYDPNTDLLMEFPDDIRLMKEAAAREAGFSRDGFGNWPEYLEHTMTFKEPQAVQWIMHFLQVMKSAIWKEVIMLREEIESIDRLRLEAMSERNFLKNDYFQQKKNRQEELDTLLLKFFAEHKDLQASAESGYKYPISPENVFQELTVPEGLWNLRQVSDVSKNPGESKEDH